MKLCGLVLICASAGAPALFAQEKTGQTAQVLQDFDKRVSDYVKLHKTAVSEVHRLKPTNSPEEIKKYEHHLAREIREARSGAVHGDVLTPAICTEIRRLIDQTMEGPEAERIRASLARGEPAHWPVLRVHQVYPDLEPLQSTPPTLLMNLPEVPKEVDYRVVGKALVLRDVEANLIVDFCENVVP